MSDLRLELADDVKSDAGPGRYADEKALDILQRYFQGKISVKDAARDVLGMLPEPEETSRSAEEDLFGFFICLMARQIPYSDSRQSRLVQLVQNISQSPKMTGKAYGDEYLIWYTMSDFKSQLREWSSADFSDDDPDGPKQYSYHLNFSGFLARLTQCGFMQAPHLFICAMRRSLEESVNHRESYECLVSAAAAWILFAGQAVFTQVVEAPIPNKNPALDRPGQLYNGPQFGLERWRFWKESFITVGSTKETGEECRRLAERAAEMMDVIERTMSF